MHAELVAIPDLHFPWAHDRAVAWCIAQIRKLSPRYICQLGDLYDQYCFSKYPKNPNVMTPKQELDRGHAKATKFWRDVTRACPEAKRYQLLGNHDVRFNKRIAERLPELQGLAKLNIYDFPGVTTVGSDRDDVELRIGGQNVVLLHGWMTRPGAHLEYLGQSVVFGHLHRPHLIHKFRRGAPTLYELNAGYLADPRAPVFQYGGTVRHRWQLGFGLVDHNGRPDFIGYPGK